MTAPSITELPETIPVFPLPGVLLLPRGQLPLNIFEPRYINMVNDALQGGRLIGMVQPRPDGGRGEDGDLYKTGCAGRITSFAETDDGRYLITLSGLCRFEIQEELPVLNGYRRARIDWSGFEKDFEVPECLDIDRSALKAFLQEYFDKQDLSCEWERIDNTPDDKLITCLAMICPFEPGEKQALLETKCCHERAQKFMTMLKIAIHDGAGLVGGCH